MSHPTTRGDARFLLVYNDRFKHIRTATQDAPNPLVGDPALELAPFLGAEPADLLALHYAGGRGAVFSADKLFDEGAGAGFLTTAALAGILAQAGIAFDLVGERELEADAPLARAQGAPTAVGLSTTHLFDAPSVAALVARVRRHLPGVPVVLGGAGATLNPSWFEASGADYQVMGDGEQALPALLARLHAGAAVDTVPNLRWRQGDRVMASGLTHAAVLDEIPLPRPDLVSDGGGWPLATFYESRRGCPYKCAFCSYPNQSPSSRHKSAEHMADEFAFYAAQGVRFVACHDSSMLTPRPRMRRFTRLLIERGSPLLWGCWGYPNELDPELLEDMFRAGCRYVAVGVESADEAVLQSMQRPPSSLGLAQGLANVQRAGMILSVQLLVGFPGETEATIATTLDFVARSAPDFYSAQPFQVRDEAAPAVRDPARYGLSIERDDAGRVRGWRHAGMDSRQAEAHVRAMQTRIALALERPFYHGLLRAGSSIGVLPPADAEGMALLRAHLLPVLKEWERALVFHPDSALGDVAPDAARHRAHRDRARRRLDEALACGALGDGGAQPSRSDNSTSAPNGSEIQPAPGARTWAR